MEKIEWSKEKQEEANKFVADQIRTCEDCKCVGLAYPNLFVEHKGKILCSNCHIKRHKEDK